MRLIDWKSCSTVLLVLALWSCAPTTSIDSSKYPSQAESPRKLLVAYSMTRDTLDPDTLKTTMSSLLESCGAESRFIFVESSYEAQPPLSEIMLTLFVGLGTWKTTAGPSAEEIFNDARKKFSDFSEDAILSVDEQSVSATYLSLRIEETYSWPERDAYAWKFQASLLDRKTNAKTWEAGIELGAGGAGRNSISNRSIAMSYGLVSRLVDDGIVRGCPEATIKSLKDPPIPPLQQ